MGVDEFFMGVDDENDGVDEFLMRELMKGGEVRRRDEREGF